MTTDGNNAPDPANSAPAPGAAAPAAPVAPVAPSPAPAAPGAPVPGADGQKQPPAAPKAPDGQPDPAAPPAPKAPDAPVDFKLPDEYKDKPWASKIKSQDDLYKQIDNLDKLAGKKAVIPDLTKATPEEREAFYAQTRPKSADEYAFTPDVPLDPTIKSGVTEMLMKNGISATQGNEIIKSYQAMEQQLLTKQFDPKDMQTAMETAFGKDWQTITGQTRNTLKGLMTPSDQTQLDAIPNVYLSLIYRTLGNVVKAYGIKETDQAHLQGGGAPAPADVNGVRQGLRDQMNALSSRPHTEPQMKELRDKLTATYKNDPRLPRG